MIFRAGGNDTGPFRYSSACIVSGANTLLRYAATNQNIPRIGLLKQRPMTGVPTNVAAMFELIGRFLAV